MTLGLKYISLAEHSGYGEAARAYLHGLSQASVPLTWTPLVWADRSGVYAIITAQGLAGLL